MALKSLTLVALICINTSLEIGRFIGDSPTIPGMRKMQLGYGPRKARPIPRNPVKKKMYQNKNGSVARLKSGNPAAQKDDLEWDPSIPSATRRTPPQVRSKSKTNVLISFLNISYPDD